jgi:hypothetical protein
MNSISWLLEDFGFTYRELADVLFLSAAMLHQSQNNQWSLPKKSELLLAHPLFTFPDSSEIPDGLQKPAFQLAGLVAEKNLEACRFPDLEPDNRIAKWNRRKTAYNLKLHKLRLELFRFEKRFQNLRARVQHTEILEGSSFEETTDLVEKWWIYQRAAAEQEISDFFTREKRRLQIRILEAELRELGGFVL